MQKKALNIILASVCCFSASFPVYSQLDHADVFEQLPADLYRSNERLYFPGTRWYIYNYDYAKYSGYQDLYTKFDGHLPSGQGLTVLQAEKDHTPNGVGNVIHLFNYKDFDSHSETVAGILSILATYPGLYTKYQTFSPSLNNFHTTDTADLRTFFNQLSSNNPYPVTSYDGIAISPAKLLNVSNTNGGSSVRLIRQFDKFVEENDIVACTAQSSLAAGNYTTSGTAYNSLVVGPAYVNPINFDGAQLNDHGAPRYKPDLIARSGASNASSFSTPTVCSAAAVLLERAQVDKNVGNAYNSVAIKAILMAGATRFNYGISNEWSDVSVSYQLFTAGDWERTSDALPTSSKYGTGALNILTAYNILDAGEFDANSAQLVPNQGWDYEDSLKVNDVNVYHFSIAQESVFSALLTWHRYINDNLDSYLPDYSVSIYRNTRRIAHSDTLTSNIELIEMNLRPGNYRMEVAVKSNGGSPEALSYGLAWITKEVAPTPENVVVINSGTNWDINWDFGFSGSNVADYKFRLQFSETEDFSIIERDLYIDSSQYTLLKPVDLNARYLRVFTYPKDSSVAYTYPSVSSVGIKLSDDNQPPTASFTYSCTNLNCSFDGSGSTDSDGTIVSYVWSFGETSSTAMTAFANAGSYPVTLTVTDNDGATHSSTQTVTTNDCLLDSDNSGSIGDACFEDTLCFPITTIEKKVVIICL